MAKWQSEEEIKAQLRELTREVRKIRNDLESVKKPDTLNERVRSSADDDQPPRPPRSSNS